MAEFLEQSLSAMLSKNLNKRPSSRSIVSRTRHKMSFWCDNKYMRVYSMDKLKKKKKEGMASVPYRETANGRSQNFAISLENVRNYLSPRFRAPHIGQEIFLFDFYISLLNYKVY